MISLKISVIYIKEYIHKLPHEGTHTHVHTRTREVSSPCSHTPEYPHTLTHTPAHTRKLSKNTLPDLSCTLPQYLNICVTSRPPPHPSHSSASYDERVDGREKDHVIERS